MSDYLRLAALYVRDLLVVDEQLIRIGRLGFELPDNATNYIGVDSLGAAQRIATGETYDGDAEVMTYAQQWRAPLTVTFYGTGAWTNIAKFAALIPSQKSRELQEALGISFYQASGITDVKLLTGKQYQNRYELTANIVYNISADVDTLRIDTAQIELRTKTGVEIEP